MGTTFLLIRHASPHLTGPVLAGRTPGVPLSSEGRVQAERLAERLAHNPITAIYSSPLERTLRTAEPLAARLKLTTQVREELVDVDFGEWAGQSIDALEPLPLWQQFNAFRSGTRIPRGEWVLEIQARVIGLMQDLRERHPRETVALVSHKDVIRVALAYFLGSPIDLMGRMEISQASYSVVELSEWGPRILTLNNVEQLGED